MPRYLYGLVTVDAAHPRENGIEGRPVEVHDLGGGLAVLTSAIDDDQVDPRRAHLTAHDRVLAAAMATGPVLPLRFGSIAETPRSVLDGLDVSTTLAHMQRLAGRVEVSVQWEPEEQIALERVAERRPAITGHDLDPVDRGRAVLDEMVHFAREDLAAVLEQVADVVDSTGPIETRGRAARVAVLVDADHLDRFMARCEELAEQTGRLGTLRTVGALPPYSFADPGSAAPAVR